MRSRLLRVAPAACLAAFALMLFGDLSHPLLWNDEGQTAMYAERVLEYGYPRVHGDDGTRWYSLDAPLAAGVKEEHDAYIGSLWGQYYFAALGVLLSRLSDDLYARTGLLRLPFALAGAAGVLLFVLAVLPLLGSAERRVSGTCVLLLLCSVSVSLLLHLREVRYYALVVLFGGALVWWWRRGALGPATAPLPWAAGLVAGLLGLFACYWPAALAFGLTLLLEGAWRAWRGEARARTQLLAAAAAAILAAPGALYFEIVQIARFHAAGFDTGPASYLRSATTIALHLLRFEWLAPVLVLKGLLLVWRSAPGDAPWLRERRRLSAFLTLLLAVYVAVVARTPFFFERYLVVLSPVLATLAVLDLTILLDRARGRGRAPALGIVAAVFTAALLVRAPEVGGRLLEIREPVRGPLDAVIPHLVERHPRPSSLVIATNYEGPVYAWYLGCRVIVGYGGHDLARERRIAPDVVVPRRGRRHREVLAEMLREGRFARTRFPIHDSWTNNIPSLSPHTAGGETHRFRTLREERPAAQVVVFERVVEPAADRSQP